MSKDRLFAPTRRDLLGMTGAAALTGLLGGACANPDASSPSTPDVTSSPVATLRNPNTSPSRAPRTLSPEEQMVGEARSLLLGTWINALSSTQNEGSTPPFGTKLTMKITNFDAWNSFLSNLIYKTTPSKTEPTEPLKATWDATDVVWIERSKGYAGTKWQGELLIQNITLIETRQPSRDPELDRARGILWDGQTMLSFIKQTRWIRRFVQNPGVKDLETFQRWINTPADLSSKTFSVPEREIIATQMTLKNDGWHGDTRLAIPTPGWGGVGMLDKMRLPSSSLWERTCQDSRSCGQVIEDINSIK